MSFAVLIIGCGMIAGGYDEQSTEPDSCLSHAGAMSQHPAFHLALCVEPDDERRRRFMERWHVPLGFATLADALGSGARFDLAIVCNPTEGHAPALEALIEGPQRLVFCEKPLTDTLERAEDLVRRYTMAGKGLAVDFNRRWDLAMITLRDRLASGELGALQFAIGHYTKGILHNGGHLIDLMQMLLGPLRMGHVSAVHSSPDAHDAPVDATLYTEHGAPAYAIAADWRCFDLFELHIVTSFGRVSITDGGHAMRLQTRESNPRYAGYFRLGEGEVQRTVLSRALYRAADNLAETLRGEGVPFCDGATALASQRLCHAIRDAALGPAP